MEPRISWFEIAASDFDRAIKFYETILDEHLKVLDLGQLKMGLFSDGGGAICYLSKWYKPSPDGTIIYLNANPDLQKVQDRIVAAGGTIIQGKKLISPERGYMCLFLDSEGNRLALHSNS
jgi:predicted enzyme related to lactoylglutathione lyase